MKQLLAVLFVLGAFGLFGQKNTYSFGLYELSDDLGVMTWEDAKKICDKMGDGWHLPSEAEFQKLYDFNRKACSHCILKDDGLYGTEAITIDRKISYWIAEKDHFIKMQDAYINDLRPELDRNATCNVRPIRMNIKEKYRLERSRHYSYDLLDDSWLEVDLSYYEPMNWVDAKEKSKEIGRGWRLPNNQELIMIFNNKHLFSDFRCCEYWSSETKALIGGSDGAFTINLYGRSSYYDLNNKFNVIFVRNSKDFEPFKDIELRELKEKNRIEQEERRKLERELEIAKYKEERASHKKFDDMPNQTIIHLKNRRGKEFMSITKIDSNNFSYKIIEKTVVFNSMRSNRKIKYFDPTINHLLSYYLKDNQVITNIKGNVRKGTFSIMSE